MSKRSRELEEAASRERAGTDSGEPEGAAPEPIKLGEVEQLQAQVADKERELAEFKDKYLRVLAESENIRKRVRQQSEESVRIQRESLLRDLLPIVDNLERAVEAARGGGNGKPIVEGVEMVLRSLVDYLRAQGVTQMTAVGQPFDPQRHEAVDQVPSAEYPPNTVVTEFNRGYLIGERMLRPARVAVARPVGGAGSGDHGSSDDGEVENS
jgi:molecular chaperone GrpE